MAGPWWHVYRVIITNVHKIYKTVDESYIDKNFIDRNGDGYNVCKTKIRALRKPEPYKGKGIRYKGEFVRSKQGKTVGGGE